jgi:hypothetical protein
LSDSLFLLGTEISDPLENSRSTGADEGTDAFNCLNNVFIRGWLFNVDKVSEHGSSRYFRQSIIMLFEIEITEDSCECDTPSASATVEYAAPACGSEVDTKSKKSSDEWPAEGCTAGGVSVSF